MARIVWTLTDGREISSYSGTSITAAVLASTVLATGAVPAGTPWREVAVGYVVQLTTAEKILKIKAALAALDIKYLVNESMRMNVFFGDSAAFTNFQELMAAHEIEAEPLRTQLAQLTG